MLYDVQQSTTAYPLLFLMVDSSDHVSPKTGLSPTVTLSKNGGSFASSAGSVTEIANGWYKVAGNATDSNTLGPLALHATASGADPTDAMYGVVAYNPQDAVHLGLTALPNTACTTNASLLTSGTGTDQISVSSGRVDVGKALGTAVTLDANNVLNVSAKYLAGTTLTARDIGSSVLLSSGTGTGQLDFTSGVVKANATQWLGGTIPAVNVTGVPLVDAKYLLGTVFSTPATAGILDVNLKNIANAAVSASTAQLGVNVVNFGGSAGTFSSGKPAVTLASTDVTGNVAADLQTIKTQTVTCAVGVTVLASVGTAATSTAQTGDCYARLGAPAGASIAADLAEIEAETDGIATLQSTANTISTNVSAIPTTPLLAANVPTNFSALLISGSGHISNVDTLTTYTNNTVQTGDSYARLGVPAGASIAADLVEIEAETDGIAAIPTTDNTSNISAIKAKTDNLPGSPAAVGSAMTLADGAITDAKITMPTEATGAPSTALQILLWIAGMFGLRKVVKDSTTIKQYMADSSTTKTTSTYTSSSGTDTVNKAS